MARACSLRCRRAGKSGSRWSVTCSGQVERTGVRVMLEHARHTGALVSRLKPGVLVRGDRGKTA